ncbi:hypothetical protein B0G57_1207 [Trinickia symbiotica]|uniref:Uncharacterized protein n=1 Tax=Trinickia symbiotica TaxID=863227 RepID=A0A2N7WV39_9BURK|nr:hypothetical protein [Trinickia symbiotica]PMS33202.1 hypothetical protein C0Z20_24645 [Trinickia symbiotica]PPK42215.1 hypothetical protein B0G57_1207 [Trinickia symbiotica]
MNKRQAEQVLYACLCEAMNVRRTINGFQPNFHDFKLISNINRDENGFIRLFSGAFQTGSITVIPFALSFEGGRARSGLGQIAANLSLNSINEQVCIFISIINYLRAIGEINTPIVAYKEMVTRGGRFAGRLAAWEAFDKFRERVLKTTVPYDLSIELFEALYCEEAKEAAAA